MSSAVDVVGIFNGSTQVLVGARPLKALIKEIAKVMEHPVESGATIVDHRIILPVEIEISMILDPATYQNTYIQIKQLFINATLLVVQTRTGRYDRMLINGMPHEESADLYDTVAMAFSLREAKLVQAKTSASLPPSSVSAPADSSTQNTGQKQSRSAAKSLVDGAVGIFK